MWVPGVAAVRELGARLRRHQQPAGPHEHDRRAGGAQPAPRHGLTPAVEIVAGVVERNRRRYGAAAGDDLRSMYMLYTAPARRRKGPKAPFQKEEPGSTIHPGVEIGAFSGGRLHRHDIRLEAGAKTPRPRRVAATPCTSIRRTRRLPEAPRRRCLPLVVLPRPHVHGFVKDDASESPPETLDPAI